MKFDITVLGGGGGHPHPTAQLVDVRDHLFLIDCGEGTQMQLRAAKVKFQRISHIFISHLHGDHLYGLPGLLGTFSLLGRTKELHLFGPPQLQEWLELTLKVSDSYLSFPLHYHEVNPKESMLVLDHEWVEVHSIPLKHRVPCSGYVFKEKELERRINKSAIHRYNISLEEMVMLKKRLKVVRADGEVLDPYLCCEPEEITRSYAFLSDTQPQCYDQAVLQEVSLLYHESTFLEEHVERAKHTRHSTAQQAGEVAAALRAKKLLLGHFSARYADWDEFKKQAEVAFKEVEIAHELSTYSIPLTYRT
jgi:ribonuclease Z